MSAALSFHILFYLLISFLISLVLPSNSKATSLSELEIFINQTQIEHKRNHQLCYSYYDSTPGLPCNSAFLGIDQKPKFWFYAYGNNNLSYFQDVADIINGPIDPERLLEMIDHNSNEHFMAGSSLGYLTDNWGFNVIPAKLILYTKIRNPALPRITLLASKESEAQFQLASFFNSEWSWGLQIRALQRRFSYSDAYFSDHLVDGSDDLYKIKNQKVLFLEPSILYTPEDMEWSPSFTVMVDQLGTSDESIDPYQIHPNLRIGVSASNNLEWGHLEVGASTQWLNLDQKSKLYSSIGGTYTLNPFQIYSTFSEIEQQYGIAFTRSNLTTAISYSYQDWSNNLASESYSLWRWDVGFIF